MKLNNMKVHQLNFKEIYFVEPVNSTIYFILAKILGFKEVLISI